jgi:hypothetical protein
MRRKIDLLILFVILVTGFFAIRNAQSIGDWWHTQRYSPSVEIAGLAEDAGMNEEGKRLFFRFSPQLVDQPQLDSSCDIEKLGCVEGSSIYILIDTTKREYKRNIVTASHEMLHVAYSRLKPSELENLQSLLTIELAKPASSDILDKLKDYPSEDYYNEAYSFIGSEILNVSPELNEYYKKYFIDRSKSTTAYSTSHT